MNMFLIRDPSSKLYRRQDGSWVPKWQTAQSCASIMAGLLVCMVADLKEYEVVQKDDQDPTVDVVYVSESSHVTNKKQAH